MSCLALYNKGVHAVSVVGRVAYRVTDLFEEM
jgi:hypothetical protein